MAKPLFTLTIGNARAAETIMSTDANVLNRIRSDASMRGLGVSLITKSDKTTDDMDASETDRMRRDGAFLAPRAA